MDDIQIVDLYWARSESAIDETNRKYGKMLRGISYTLLTSNEDAEECVSDTYLAAWNRMPTDRPSYLGAFLAKIVRRSSIDRLRHDNRKKRGGSDKVINELSECIADSRTVESNFENGLLRSSLNRFLYALDNEKRAIFTLRYFYSRSIRDISKQMNMSEGKVKSILFRLRSALKMMLEEENTL